MPHIQIVAPLPAFLLLRQVGTRCREVGSWLESSTVDGDSPNRGFQVHRAPGTPNTKKHKIAVTADGSPARANDGYREARQSRRKSETGRERTRRSTSTATRLARPNTRHIPRSVPKC